jgi:hypothetical protein
MNINFNRKPLMDTLASLYATAAVFGIDSAEYRIRQARKRNKAGEQGDGFNFDWANWRPGNRAAAVLVNPKGGLAKRLAERNKTIKGLEDTTVDRIGRILADNLEEGLPYAEAAKTLVDKLDEFADDPRRADVIAKTETNRAIWDEQVGRYSDMGIEKYEWLVLTPCDDCLVNDGAVVAIGEPFPNGWVSIDDSHPNCNCTLAPYFDDEFQEDFAEYDRFGQPVDDIEMGARPTVAKYSDDQPRDEHGRFGSGGGGEGLNTDHKFAVIDYAGSEYKYINTSLRQGPEYLKEFSPSRRDEINETIKNLDDAFRAVAPTTEDMTVYRGVHEGATADRLRELEVGDRFTDKAFTSTSKDATVIESFRNPTSASPGISMKIDIPQGSKAIDVYKETKNASPIAVREQEIILPRETTYEVTGRDGNNLTLKVVTND